MSLYAIEFIAISARFHCAKAIFDCEFVTARVIAWPVSHAGIAPSPNGGEGAGFDGIDG